jgi:hypothetical protein
LLRQSGYAKARGAKKREGLKVPPGGFRGEIHEVVVYTLIKVQVCKLKGKIRLYFPIIYSNFSLSGNEDFYKLILQK